MPSLWLCLIGRLCMITIWLNYCLHVYVHMHMCIFRHLTCHYAGVFDMSLLLQVSGDHVWLTAVILIFNTISHRAIILAVTVNQMFEWQLTLLLQVSGDQVHVWLTAVILILNDIFHIAVILTVTDWYVILTLTVVILAVDAFDWQLSFWLDIFARQVSFWLYVFEWQLSVLLQVSGDQVHVWEDVTALGVGPSVPLPQGPALCHDGPHRRGEC